MTVFSTLGWVGKNQSCEVDPLSMSRPKECRNYIPWVDRWAVYYYLDVYGKINFLKFVCQQMFDGSSLRFILLSWFES